MGKGKKGTRRCSMVINDVDRVSRGLIIKFCRQKILDHFYSSLTRYIYDNYSHTYKKRIPCHDY